MIVDGLEVDRVLIRAVVTMAHRATGGRGRHSSGSSMSGTVIRRDAKVQIIGPYGAVLAEGTVFEAEVMPPTPPEKALHLIADLLEDSTLADADAKAIRRILDEADVR